MEHFRHIKETSQPNTGEGETEPNRREIKQLDVYDPKSETHEDQIRVREYLNNFDEEALRDIFAEHFRKSGNVEDSMNWIPFDKVRILHETLQEEGEAKKNRGTHSLAYGVQLYSNALRNNLEQTLWTLIHEECHAMSQDTVREYDIIDEKGKTIAGKGSKKSGVSELVIVDKYGSDRVEREKKKSHNDINEGITELLTERIYREYKRRTGTADYSPHQFELERKKSDTERVVADSKFGVYERDWQNAKLYIGIISAITDVPEDVVEDSIIRTYIRNGDILPNQDPEIRSAFEEIYENLDTVLSIIISSEKRKDSPLASYVDHVNRQDVPEELKLKLKYALQKVKDEWGEAYKHATSVV